MISGVNVSLKFEACTSSRRRRSIKSRKQWRQTTVSQNIRKSLGKFQWLPRGAQYEAETRRDSLSEWEIRLRDVLGLRKKMKKSDWPVVYQHYKHRQDIGKDSSIWLNNYRIENKRAWKEMRRHGALRCSPRQGKVTTLFWTTHASSIRVHTDVLISGSPLPLPHGVFVRTPSPNVASRRSTTPRVNLAKPISNPAVTASSCNTTQDLQVRPADLHSFLALAHTPRRHLESVPFVQMMRKLIRE